MQERLEKMSDYQYRPDEGETPIEVSNMLSEDGATLPVPPPDFHERLAAAQRARELQARRAMEFRTPENTATELSSEYSDQVDES
jgi:hypothetical protein